MLETEKNVKTHETQTCRDITAELQFSRYLTPESN